MTERVLCDEGVRVALECRASDAVLAIKDGGSVRFAVERGELEGVLNGDTVQLSAAEGYCRIGPSKDGLTLEYALTGEGVKRCRLSKAEFAAALGWLRGCEADGRDA